MKKVDTHNNNEVIFEIRVLVIEAVLCGVGVERQRVLKQLVKNLLKTATTHAIPVLRECSPTPLSLIYIGKITRFPRGSATNILRFSIVFTASERDIKVIMIRRPPRTCTVINKSLCSSLNAFSMRLLPRVEFCVKETVDIKRLNPSTRHSQGFLSKQCESNIICDEIKTISVAKKENCF